MSWKPISEIPAHIAGKFLVYSTHHPKGSRVFVAHFTENGCVRWPGGAFAAPEYWMPLPSEPELVDA